MQSFNHQRVDIEQFGERLDQALAVALQRIWQRAVLVAVVMLMVFGAVATLLWVGGQDVLAGRTSPGDLAAFIFYAFVVAGSVGAISEVWSDLQRAVRPNGSWNCCKHLMKSLTAKIRWRPQPPALMHLPRYSYKILPLVILHGRNCLR